MTLEEYEKQQPIGSKKVDMGIAVVRMYEEDGTIIVKINRKIDGHECLPNAYLLGVNFSRLDKIGAKS